VLLDVFAEHLSPLRTNSNCLTAFTLQGAAWNSPHTSPPEQ